MTFPLRRAVSLAAIAATLTGCSIGGLMTSFSVDTSDKGPQIVTRSEEAAQNPQPEQTAAVATPAAKPEPPPSIEELIASTETEAGVPIDSYLGVSANEEAAANRSACLEASGASLDLRKHVEFAESKVKNWQPFDSELSWHSLQQWATSGTPETGALTSLPRNSTPSRPSVSQAPCGCGGGDAQEVRSGRARRCARSRANSARTARTRRPAGRGARSRSRAEARGRDPEAS